MQPTKSSKRPTFTVITVCYNSVKTIERTIQSVLGQTFNDYEYWIIDGASTDGTLDIIDSYKEKFEGRMFLVSEPDKGIYDAMNKGIALAKGEIIGLINSDDWLEPDALLSVYTAIDDKKKASNQIYCGWVCFHYKDGRTNILKTDKKRHERCFKDKRMGVRHPATFVGHDVYENIGGFDERFCIMADADFIFRSTEAGVSFIFIGKVLSNMSDGGISNDTRGSLSINSSEIKQLCRKHSMTKLSYYRIVIPRLVRLYIKAFIPQSLLRLYRNMG